MPEDRTPKDVFDWLGVREVPDWAKARPLGALVGLLLMVLFGLALAALVGVLVHTIHQAFTPGSDGPNLGAGALIAALLGAPFVIWGTVLKHRTVTFQKEGHITDRINKAVEMLGAEKVEKVYSLGEDGKPIQAERTVANIEVRIGAILSLERIAQDSTAYDKGRDHVRLMEILCAYVRENSNARKPVDFSDNDWKPLKDGASAEERQAYLEKRLDRFGGYFASSMAWKWARNLPAPREDIALALTVLGRRTVDQRKAEAAWPNPPKEYTIWPFDLPCPQLPEKRDDEAFAEAEIDHFTTELATWKKELSSYPTFPKWRAY
jgi:hypothetical protein